jgi:hypothetical protein
LNVSKFELDLMINEYTINETNYTIMKQTYLKENELYESRENETRIKYNISEYPIFPRAKKKLDLKKQHIDTFRKQLNYNYDIIQQEKLNFDKTSKKLIDDRVHVDLVLNSVWLFTVVLFLTGVCIGAFISKYIADEIGRRNGILFHYLFSIIGSFLIFIVPIINIEYFSSILIKLSQFVHGFQGGIGFCISILYLNEISPILIRGETGMLAPLQFIFGIIFSQLLGSDLILGKKHLWHVLLALPVLLSFIGAVLFSFLPDSPKALVLDRNNIIEAKKGNF